MSLRFAAFVHADILSLLPPCAECGEPVMFGRHTSPSAAEPCRDGFPLGCANPTLHHLYRLPAYYLGTFDTETVR